MDQFSWNSAKCSGGHGQTIEISLEFKVSFFVPVIVDRKLMNFTAFSSMMTGTMDDIACMRSSRN